MLIVGIKAKRVCSRWNYVRTREIEREREREREVLRKQWSPGLGLEW
jgi:hypothetical protein